MFAHPRPKKSFLQPATKRRKTQSSIEEINFDFNARAEYLTGFHKRKVQRAKQAREEAAKKARDERIAMRKQVNGEFHNHKSMLRKLATRRAPSGIRSPR